MANDKFTLTVREEDLFEIYREKLKYRLFSRANYSDLLFAAMCFLLGLISALKAFSGNEFFFLALCFTFGFGYQVIILLKKYWDFKTVAEETISWVESLKKYKSHTIEFDDTCFKYVRDYDIFVHILKNVKKTYRTDDYFYFESLDNGDIILPRKSFANGEFVNFLSAFDERNK